MKTFEKLLISKKILTIEQVEYYRCVEAKDSQKRPLGKILEDEGLINPELLLELSNIAKEREKFKNKKSKHKKDKKILQAIKKMSLIRVEDIETCKKEAIRRQKGLISIFIEKKYITPYMLRKLCNNKPLKSSTPQDLIIDVTEYQQDRFFGKIAVKNEFVSEKQLEECWQILKDNWPQQNLVAIFLEKGLISKKNAEKLLKTLKETVSSRYPFFQYQKNDVKLARQLAKKKYLTPWRLNKCLLKQLNIIRRQKKYVPLLQISIDDGYLTEYFFKYILKVNTSNNTHVHPIQKEDIPHIIKNAISDVHLILDDNELEDLQIASSILDVPEKEIEEIEEIDEEGLESIANFTRDQLGITASQTLYMSEEDLKIFDDDDEMNYKLKEKNKSKINFSLVSEEDEDEEDFDFVVDEDID